MLLVCSAVFLVSVHGVFVRLGVWLGHVGLEVLEAPVPQGWWSVHGRVRSIENWYGPRGTGHSYWCNIFFSSAP